MIAMATVVIIFGGIALGAWLLRRAHYTNGDIAALILFMLLMCGLGWFWFLGATSS